MNRRNSTKAPLFTAKHYEAFALLYANADGDMTKFAESILLTFRDDNPKFNLAKFTARVNQHRGEKYGR